ncbi:MAG: MFS transporter, partial [Polaromonas sp.]|nr:MFS transporter [Polaromonas sp.]
MAQFCGTSLWFAVNAVMPDLQRELGWPAAAVGNLTSALQLGFIAGTLVFALLAVADRFSARRVFLLCSLAGALCTVGAWAMVRDFNALLAWRFATGFFLAGIYPVGMKIASQWFPRGLGAALGLLIGALVLGSASAHALRAIGGLGVALPWPSVMLGVAALAAAGGVLLYRLLPEPPGAARRPSTLQWRALASMWTDRRVRASVLGYFGHMWELYTLWVLVPLILASRLDGAALSLAAFVVLGAGAIGCVAGGRAAQTFGSARVASVQLAVSGLCCLLAPWLFGAPAVWFGVWLVVWGITVSGDSPQFSALTASNAPPQAVGSVLTLTNSLGFAISIVSIELFTRLSKQHALATLLPWLGVGPVLG